MFYSCFGFLNLQRGNSHYGGRDRTGSSYATALDRSNQDGNSFFSRGSGHDNKNFYAQVRDRVHTSPDAKIHR